MYTPRLFTHLDPEAPAKERPRLRVPQMPPERGDACCWHCLPDSIEPDCLVHGPTYRLVADLDPDAPA